MRMSWQDIVKEDIEEFPLVDQFRGMLKEFSKQAETIKTPLDMLNLFKEIEETVDATIPTIEDIHRHSMQKPKEGFSDREARPEFAREVDNQRL